MKPLALSDEQLLTIQRAPEPESKQMPSRWDRAAPHFERVSKRAF